MWPLRAAASGLRAAHAHIAVRVLQADSSFTRSLELRGGGLPRGWSNSPVGAWPASQPCGTSVGQLHTSIGADRSDAPVGRAARPTGASVEGRGRGDRTESGGRGGGTGSGGRGGSRREDGERGTTRRGGGRGGGWRDRGELTQEPVTGAVLALVDELRKLPGKQKADAVLERHGALWTRGGDTRRVLSELRWTKDPLRCLEVGFWLVNLQQRRLKQDANGKGVLEHRQLRELLEAAVDCLKPERGEKLLRLYHTAGLPVTAESLSWLLEGYRRCHRWEQAAEAYRTSERRYGVVADHRGMLVMIHVEGRRGDWRKALGIYEQLETVTAKTRPPAEIAARGVSNEFLNKAAATIIGVLGRERQLTPAIDVFRRLLLRVDADVNAFVVNRVLDVCSAVGDARQAEWVFDQMRQGGIVLGPKAFQILCKARGNIGDAAGARGWIEAMRAEGHTPDLMTYNCLLAAHRKQGDCTAALAILDQMLLKGDKDAWQRGDVDEYTCTALMQVCNAGNRLDLVQQVWERLGAAGVPRTAHSYNVLMHACNCAGQWETTVAQWEALQAAEVAPCVRTYTCLIRALGQIGEPQLALEAFNDMKARGIAPDTQCVNTTMQACKELDMLAQILSDA